MLGYPPVDNEVVNTELQSAMRDLSRSKYSRPKDEVAAEVAESLNSGVTAMGANTVDSGTQVNQG